MEQRNNLVLKRVLFWLVLILLAFGLLGNGITFLQSLPFVAFLIMASLDMKMRANLQVAIIVFSVIMATVNGLAFGTPSWPDVIIWGAIAISWFK